VAYERVKPIWYKIGLQALSISRSICTFCGENTYQESRYTTGNIIARPGALAVVLLVISNFLNCDAVSVGTQLQIFRRSVMYSSSG